MGVSVLVAGSGGREHALAWALKRSPRVDRVGVAPGNGGTALIGDNLPVQVDETAGIVRAARDWGADLVVVGPEAALAAGVVDALEAAGIRAFGPTKAAAEIEASKAFAKQVMHEAGVPTAASRRVTALTEARRALAEMGAPIVVKADGLAAGKGVTVALNREDADAALVDCLERRVFGDAGSTVILEERLVGREVSLLALVDGEHVLPLLPACDYKPIGDGDTGPNTGGMGVYSLPPWFGPADVERAAETILKPVVRRMAELGRPFRGVLYAGLMVTDAGPKVLEFNARFGDPETQVILPCLDVDLLDLLEASMNGDLGGVPPIRADKAGVGVVLASAGYPGKVKTGVPISGLDSLPEDVLVFHAGTRRAGGQIVTDGGRVLNVVATAPSIREARRRAYDGVSSIQFDGMQYRTDIALRELNGDGS